ncbi:hypothetical protein RDWZM_008915 [Blomia tropicalis]|uniref:Uncharacterized protein n=1 Tax=Blomia tropicalis TaxID=40697 RepID=A0A9Q0M0E0_BLOTA|nr:hypothetical protein RDWZM_008915 [Blomia tropicalis]
MDSTESENIFINLKLFNEFVCEEKVYSIDEVIHSSIVLLKHCPASRIAVFKFYSNLFDEYCYEYCLVNGNNVKSCNEEQQKTTEFFQRFVKALNLNQFTSKNAIKEENVDEIKSIDDCPQSPSQELVEDCEMEDLTAEKESDLSVIMNIFDRHMPQLEDIFEHMLVNNPNPEWISVWALDLASEISKKFSSFVAVNPNISRMKPTKLDHLSLVSALGFWLQCSPMQVLFKIILISANTSKTKSKILINRLLKFSPYSDWILANICTNISQNLNLTDYIEQLINNASSYSVTFILSFVSEHNPQAIANCSKSNLPLLLQLCTNSKPLLDLLANDIIKKSDYSLNVESLNKLAETHTSDEINNYIIFCVLNAPNALELLKMSFDLVVHQQTSEELRNRIIRILSLVTMQIHKHVYDPMNSSDDMFPIISLLRNNIQQLISHPSIPKNTSLKRLQLRLLNLICICYGCEFITEVFHHLMNVSTMVIGLNNYENPKLNPLLLPLFNKLRLHFGYHNIQNCINDTIKLYYSKKLIYWAYLSQIVESISIPLDISDLIVHLRTNSYNHYKNTFQKYYILKILIRIFDNNEKFYHRNQYNLCISVVNIFFDMINEMQSNDNRYLVVIINNIVLCQKFLTNLSTKFSLNEHIIARYILEYIQEKVKLFSDEYSPAKEVPTYKFHEYKKLMDENLCKFSHVLNKAKKNRLIPSHKANNQREHVQNKCVSFNKQLLIDLLQSCIKDKVSFAKNFVNSLSNELLLNDVPWQEEDPKDGQLSHLRMTFEKDLYILHLFEEKPILWNVLEFIGHGQYLKHCSVVIRAMLNVQRANLASSSYREENIFYTKKILTLMANDEILPEKPFIFVAELLPKVKNLEMSYVLHDIAKYIRDCNTNPKNKDNLKPYMERLRIIMATNYPGEDYSKIFKYV